MPASIDTFQSGCLPANFSCLCQVCGIHCYAHDASRQVRTLEISFLISYLDSCFIMLKSKSFSLDLQRKQNKLWRILFGDCHYSQKIFQRCLRQYEHTICIPSSISRILYSWNSWLGKFLSFLRKDNWILWHTESWDSLIIHSSCIKLHHRQV